MWLVESDLKSIQVEKVLTVDAKLRHIPEVDWPQRKCHNTIATFRVVCTAKLMPYLVNRTPPHRMIAVELHFLRNCSFEYNTGPVVRGGKTSREAVSERFFILVRTIDVHIETSNGVETNDAVAKAGVRTRMRIGKSNRVLADHYCISPPYRRRQWSLSSSSGSRTRSCGGEVNPDTAETMPSGSCEHAVTGAQCPHGPETFPSLDLRSRDEGARGAACGVSKRCLSAPRARSP